MQIRPGEYLPIVRQLEDPSDANTYYVRAYVYKHKGGTETLLATLNLNDKGSQRFTYEYETPLEASGEGYFLTILTRVFTDSGYTAESSLYGRTVEEYLVDERWGLRFGTGGGADVDYKRMRNIIQEELGKRALPKPADLTPLLNALKEVNRTIRDLRFPEPEKIDFGPVIKAIENTQQAVKNINIPKQEKPDFSPIIQEIKNIEKQGVSRGQIFQSQIEKLKTDFEALKEKIKKGIRFKLIRVDESSSPQKRKIIL